MAIGEKLKSFRQEGYGGGEKKEDSPGPRIIKLTDDEAKALGEYAGGEEATCTVSGRLEGNSLTVMSVSPAEGGPSEEDEMAKQMMGPMGGPPMMS